MNNQLMQQIARWFRLMVLVAGMQTVHAASIASDPRLDVNREVRFDQNRGGAIPMDAVFTDDQNRSIKLGKFFHSRPVVLAMGYYGCPMLCGVVLNALVASLQEFPPNSAVRDFDFVFISVDVQETAQLASEKKANYLRSYSWPPAAERWHFLTGTVESIQDVADAVGFRYRYDAGAKQYVHPSGLVFLTPQGRISGYMPGVNFPPRQFADKMTAARSSQMSKPADNLLLLCFTHNPISGPVGYFVVLALRTGAVLTLLGLVLFIIRLSPRQSLKDKL